MQQKDAPRRLFEKLLDKSDTPPETLSMYALYRVSMQFGQVQPWLTLHESEVFAVDPGPGEPRCYCSVIGSGGSLYRLAVYLGPEGYMLYRRMSAGMADPTDLFTSCDLLYADFVPPPALTKPDRDMLKLFGSKLEAHALWPQFRSIRRYHRDWYVDAREANILMECLRAGVVIAADVGQNGDATHWKSPTTLPLVRVVVDGSHVNTAIEQVDAPPPVQVGRMQGRVFVDETQVDDLLRKAATQRTGAWEVDSFWSPFGIGKKNQRPRMARMSMAVDAESGYVFQPILEEASVPEQKLLADAICSAIESCKALPVELHVPSADRRTAIAPLAQALGIPVKIRAKLPRLAQARASIEALPFG